MNGTSEEGWPTDLLDTQHINPNIHNAVMLLKSQHALLLPAVIFLIHQEDSHSQRWLNSAPAIHWLPAEWLESTWGNPVTQNQTGNPEDHFRGPAEGPEDEPVAFSWKLRASLRRFLKESQLLFFSFTTKTKIQFIPKRTLIIIQNKANIIHLSSLTGGHWGQGEDMMVLSREHAILFYSAHYRSACTRAQVLSNRALAKRACSSWNINPSRVEPVLL